MEKEPRLVSVYVLTNRLNAKQYVGISANLPQRLRQHRHSGSGCWAIRSAIKKYGWDSFDVNVFANVPREVANTLEIALIVNLKTKRPNGYNLTDGGEGVSGHTWTLEDRKRMSETRRGKPMHPNTLAELSKYWGSKPSDETKAKLSAKKKGVNFSEGHRKSISEARKGKAVWGTRIAINGVEYPSMQAAADALGVTKAAISLRAKKKWPNYEILGRFPLGEPKP